jgi:hypothetical protein
MLRWRAAGGGEVLCVVHGKTVAVSSGLDQHSQRLSLAGSLPDGNDRLTNCPSHGRGVANTKKAPIYVRLNVPPAGRTRLGRVDTVACIRPSQVPRR